MKISVVGLGKIGLPLAVQYAGRGHEVFGVDINADLVDAVNSGLEPFPGEFDLGRRLKELVGTGRLTATTDANQAIRVSEAVVVVVPVIIEADGTPDFSAMDAAVQSIGQGVQAGTVVSFETTVPIGTTRNRFAPVIERLSGLTLGQDLHIIYSPERVLTGRVFEDLRRYPKLVGGLDASGGQRGVELYEALLEFDERTDLARGNGVWDLGSAEAAEFAKLAETTYRDVNIALANQFAVFAEGQGIDVHAVIAACNSQPYSHIHSPGVAVGGHCIPVYPHLYLSNDPEALLVRTAREVNAAMPKRVVDRLEAEMGGLKNQTVVILGAAYRGGVKESAFSGAFPLALALQARGALVRVHDPLYSDQELVELGFVPFHEGDQADAAVLQANHEQYLDWGPDQLSGIRYFSDGRNWTQEQQWPGVAFHAIGR